MYSENGSIKLPTNIKQIGNTGKGLKIYMEDYVHTYIQQYAKDGEGEERIGILVGENYIIDGCEALFINGIIQGKHSEVHNSMRILTEKSWKYVEETIVNYFPTSKIVGWVYIQPGFGEYINENQINYHQTFFAEPYQVFLVYDPTEKVNCFFAWEKVSETQLSLQAKSGYIIYYDKNENMQFYMLDNSLTNGPIETEENFTKRLEERSHLSVENEPVISNPKPRTVRAKTKLMQEQKKMINLFGSLSAILFLVCFIMGAGLIQNEDRISKLETQLNSIDNSYQFLLTQIKEDKVQSVFGSQTSANGENSAITTLSAQTEAATNEPSTEPKTEKTTEKVTESPETRETDNNVQETAIVVPPVEQLNLTDELPSINVKYIVTEGDTLGHISRKFYNTEGKITEIMELNNITNPDDIKIGQELLLP